MFGADKLMKISFSTLGCPDWNFSEIFSTAADLGYNGIEIRGIADEIYAPKSPVFAPENIDALKAKLSRAGISIPILTSGAYIVDNPDLPAAEFEVKDYVMLAAKLGAPYVRVLGEKGPAPESEQTDISLLRREYASMCDFAANFGIGVLIETNGILANSAVMKRFIEETDRENSGVIWDIHHTVRYFGESPEYTVSNIGKYIKHTHIKDSVRGTNGRITYMLTGYGDLPIEKAVKALEGSGYGGYYSYEWVKRWSRELAEPGVAFYQYINYMRDIF